MRTWQPQSQPGALAVVLGDINVVRALGAAGISCASLCEVDDPSPLSRHVRIALDWIDPWTDPAGLVASLAEFGASQPLAPVLYPQTDATLLVISRSRARLASRCRFLLAEPQLVEALVDKARFAQLAYQHDLPVPCTWMLRPGDPAPDHLRFPLVIKPLSRSPRWDVVEPESKAVGVLTPSHLGRLRAQAPTLELLAQQEVPGPETRIESYHVYVDMAGTVVAEFTGRKLRTRPPRYGYSTAVEVADRPDVRRLGREIVERLGIKGVAKLDFKRAPDGRLFLLEVNPRFSLWHYPAALAGINLPALVYADVTGSARPPARRLRDGVTWCQPREDLRAARDHGLPWWRWLAWFARCDAKSSLSLRDPGPLLRGHVRAALPKLKRASASGVGR